MPEKELEVEDIDSDSDVEEPVDTQDKQKNSKTFTESQVSKMIKDRLAREKALNKKQKEEFDASLADYETRVASYEAILKKGIDEQMKSVPKPVRELLEALPIDKQMEWLSNPDNLVTEKKKIPKTPDEEQGKPSGIASKYKWE